MEKIKRTRTSRKSSIDEIKTQDLSKSKPVTKSITKKELKEIAVPTFQRWIVEKNISQLKESISLVGMQRCPILCYVKSHKKTYIIDGNHLRTIIINDDNLNDSDEITCIYNEVEDFMGAANIFKMLNTKGKTLDLVDITNLYMHAHYETDNVYRDIWGILGNPISANETLNVPGFSKPTIVEFLVSDKIRYRDGECIKRDIGSEYFHRKVLLEYLLGHSKKYWDSKLGEDKEARKPSGAAILGFANYWFKNKLHLVHEVPDFLHIITDVFRSKQDELKSGLLVINRDNAGKHLEKYLAMHSNSILSK